MKDYLVDREALSKIADSLIAQKYPNQPTGAHAELHAKISEELDEQITTAVFSNLSESDLDTLNKLLDQKSSTETDFRNFFKSASLDLSKITSEAIHEYGEHFLEGGRNA